MPDFNTVFARNFVAAIASVLLATTSFAAVVAIPGAPATELAALSVLELA